MKNLSTATPLREWRGHYEPFACEWQLWSIINVYSLHCWRRRDAMKMMTISLTCWQQGKEEEEIWINFIVSLSTFPLISPSHIQKVLDENCILLFSLIWYASDTHSHLQSKNFPHFLARSLCANFNILFSSSPMRLLTNNCGKVYTQS